MDRYKSAERTPRKPGALTPLRLPLTRWQLIRALTLCLALSITFAQLSTPLPQGARAALERAQSAATEALQTYDTYRPDQPLFREAVRYGREAAQLAPDSAEPLRFLAEVYSVTNFYGPAFRSWQAYLDAGGALTRSMREQAVDAGTELAYERYAQGDKGEALRLYREVIDLVPDNPEAYVWAGRILLETDRPDEAVGYWQEVTGLKPGDESAEYFLRLAQERARYGTDAVTAFREGVRLYEEGDQRAAREQFARATSLNDRYPAAWAYLGRTAFETNNYAAAETFYQNASQLEPNNQTYRYFYEESQRRQGEQAEVEEQGAQNDRPFREESGN